MTLKMDVTFIFGGPDLCPTYSLVEELWKEYGLYQCHLPVNFYPGFDVKCLPGGIAQILEILMDITSYSTNRNIQGRCSRIIFEI